VADVARQEGEHFTLRFDAPEIAASARPGQFVNVRFPGGIEPPAAFDSYADLQAHHKTHPPAEPPFLLARPFGVRRVHPDGSVEILFKAVGRGTRLLAQAQPGAKLDVLGPVGNSFDLSTPPDTAILVAGGTGIAPLYLLADTLHKLGSKLVVLVGTGYHVPMSMSDSETVVHFLDEEVTAVIDEYAEMGALVRVATMTPRPCCFTGTSADLLQRYLQSLEAEQLKHHAIYSCGPWAMQAAVAKLAETYKMQCQVLLEERMGCGLGACMGCVVKVKQPDGTFKNKRVCVDGPVFRAGEIGWDLRE